MKAVQYVTKQNLTKAFGTFEGKMNRRFDRLEGSIESLAQAVQVGFQETHQLIRSLSDREEGHYGELKGDIKSLQTDVKSLQGDVQRIDNRLGRQQEIIDETKQANRILDGRMGVVEAKVGIPAGTKC